MEIVSTEEVKRRIETALPGSDVQVDTFRGADHFQAVVVAPQFRGKTLVEQHKMVYAAVEGLLGGPMHALSLKTAAPPESDESD
jgi:stress-induced morphogen